MRLINTTTLIIEQFKTKPPPYAILSHTWGPDEVTFEDCTESFQRSQSKAGFIKVRGACAQAKKDGYNYVWIDTNCIKKTHATELSEAITSMFRWYKDAGICYAYLADVPDNAVGVDKRGQLAVSTSFEKSRWFTRGWTLQELLAPKNVVFFSEKWRPLGTKITLQQPLSQITGVPVDYLVGNKPLRAASVAERMSWMSKRVTQRTEDLAYSMLGIFDIFMPYSYGDGTGAFLRLQEAIMEKLDDHSIFCWEWDHTVDPSWVSVFAPSPRAFANSAKYSPRPWDNGPITTTYHVRNGGLSIALPLVQTADPSVVLAILDVEVHGRECTDFQVGIPLQIGPIYQRLSFPPRPVQVNGQISAPTKSIFINTTEKGHGHRFDSRLLAEQESQLRRLYSDQRRAASARVGFFLAFHIDGCEVELVPSQPGVGAVELHRSISTVSFSDGVASRYCSFMTTALKIKHKTLGETIVLLAARRQASGYVFFTQAFPPNARHTKTSIERALAMLREQTERENGDKSYQSGREVCVTMGGSFPFSGNGGPTIKAVQVWVDKTAGNINPVQRVRTGLLGLKKTLSRS